MERFGHFRKFKDPSLAVPNTSQKFPHLSLGEGARDPQNILFVGSRQGPFTFMEVTSQVGGCAGAKLSLLSQQLIFPNVKVLRQSFTGFSTGSFIFSHYQLVIHILQEHCLVKAEMVLT